LTAGGAAYCWGGNALGNFGNEKKVVDGSCAVSGLSRLRPDPYCWRPVPAAGGLMLRALTAGSFHACGLTLEGTVYCWGDNGFGQLGEGTIEPSPIPLPVASDLQYVELSGGESYACARTVEGVAQCWGVLPWGALLEQTTGRDNKLFIPSRPAPVEGVVPLFRSISVGYEVACALEGSGRAHCWGDNLYGQMGQDGTGPYRLNPEPILGEHTFRTIIAGYQRVCGLAKEGRAFCWGRNDQGQLGDGTTLDRALPVEVRGP
jgi:alpha-tubulin suppressor-like RCC1 family protein